MNLDNLSESDIGPFRYLHMVTIDEDSDFHSKDEKVSDLTVLIHCLVIKNSLMKIWHNYICIESCASQ